MTKPDPPEGLTNPEPPQWLSKLNRWDLAALLRDPHAPLSGSAVDSLRNVRHIRQVNPSGQMGAQKEQLWHLTGEAIEQLEGVRDHLNSWWGKLSERTRDALKDSTKTAGMVPGEYRDDVAALGPMGEVDSEEQDLRLPFKPPDPVLAYLDYLPPLIT